MNQPDDQTGRDAQPIPVPDDVAHHLRSWARTITRWSTTGEPCFLITEHGVRPATLAGVADAAERLRKRRDSQGD